MKKIIAVLLIVASAAAFCITPASAEEAGDTLLITNCDSTLNWSANSAGMDALVVDTENKTEGSASVGATAINGKLNQIAYVSDVPIDASGYSYLEFDIYFSDMTWFSDCSSVMIEITSSGMCDVESNRYMKKIMRTQFEENRIEDKENWYHFALSLDEPQGTANGVLNKANFNYFRFYSVDPISTTLDYTMRIDNMMLTKTTQFTAGAMEEEEEESETETVSEPVVQEVVVENSANNALKIAVIAEAAVAAVLVIAFVIVLAVRLSAKRKNTIK